MRGFIGKIGIKEFILLAGLLVIVFVSLMNIFPKGYTFSGGDVTQYINLKNNFNMMLYTWDSVAGSGVFLQFFSYSIFYIPFYFLSYLGISASAQSFFYFFIFLAASYISFFLASKKFGVVKESFGLRVLISLVYAINPYTLYVFIYTWGYSPFLLLYPLIPLIFAFTYSYFKGSSVFNKDLAVLGIVFFFI